MIEDRQVRVFVSSAFRDMQEERNYLVTIVFPQLRKLCEARDARWGEVDLRWGITDEQAAEGKVLPLCLEEINRCRPYFIGLLGERYGWIPRDLPEALVHEQPWLDEYRERSVTELEIVHGVLRDQHVHGHAHFYFRSPEYLARLALTDAEDAAPESATALEKLAQLKDRIRRACASGVCRLRENYNNVVQLGQWVLEDFTALVDKLFPEESVPDLLDREAADHHAYARARAAVYVGREEYFNRLDAHAASGGLVVLGDSGAGKSTLLANWALQYRRQHPDDLVVMHFVGATPHGDQWEAIIRRLLGELQRRFKIEEEIPQTSDALRSAFASGLRAAATKGRIVLVLDALDQLADREGGPDLVWLPEPLPANVHVVASTLPGRALDALTARGWPALRVHPLDIEERRQLIRKHLAQHMKSLDRARTERIATAPQSANPLYLWALLEELRVFGEHERLEERIAYYLAATTTGGLYEAILARYEQDYELYRPHLVRDVMSLIWAARRGLSETELLTMLGADGLPIPHAWWTPLFLAAEQSLAIRSGLIGFSHDFLRKAVEQRYLPNEQKKRTAHLRVSAHFAFGSPGPRQLDELPWQLMAGSHWPPLYDLLCDTSFLHDLWLADELDAKGYWARLEEQSFRMVEAYRPVLEDPGGAPELTFLISLLFMHAGHYAEALALLTYLVEHYRRTGNQKSLRACLVNQAVILRERGEDDRAAAVLAESEQTSAKEEDRRFLRLTLHNQAVMLRKRGDLREAMALHKRVEQLCLERDDKPGLQACLGEQALILEAGGDLDGALALQKQTEALCREAGNKEGLATSLGNQARIFHARHNLDDAMRLYTQVERLFRELGDKDGLQRTLFNEAGVLARRGDLHAAMALLERQEQLCRELGDNNSLRVCQQRQAALRSALY